MQTTFIHRELRCRKRRIRERARWYSDDFWRILEPVINGRPAFGTEVKQQPIAAVCHSNVARCTTGERDAITRKPCLSTERASGALLAR